MYDVAVAGREDERDWRNPAVIVKLIRDGAVNLDQVAQRLNLHRGHDSRWHVVENTLHQLRDEGIITARGPELEGLALSAASERFIHQLGLSLTALVKTTRRDVMWVRPFHGVPGRRNLDVFVLMPFRPDIDPVYQDHIRTVCAVLELKAARADDFFGAHEVMKDVWSAIASAKVIVADCTGRNPNVFYEIGLAHALGKPTIMITQSADDIPFDLRAVRHLKYALTPRGMKQFEEHLRNALAETMASLAE